MLKSNILIIDDDPFICKSVGDYLALNGFTVNTVSSGSDAVHLIQGQKYDLFIVDYDLGGNEPDGCTLIKEIKAYCPDAGTVVLTGESDPKALVSLSNVAPDYILQKPASLRQVLDTINALKQGTLPTDFGESDQKNQQKPDTLELLEAVPKDSGFTQIRQDKLQDYLSSSARVKGVIKVLDNLPIPALLWDMKEGSIRGNLFFIHEYGLPPVFPVIEEGESVFSHIKHQRKDRVRFVDTSFFNDFVKTLRGAGFIDRSTLVVDGRGGIRQINVFSVVSQEDSSDYVLLCIVDRTDEMNLKKAVANLRKSEREIDARYIELKNSFVALERLGEYRSRQVEENIVRNVQMIISPLVDQLRNRVGEENKDILDELEKNLDRLSDGFIANMSNLYGQLSPMEMKVASMIRDGKKSKDISSLLAISVRTVETHRNNIRKKLKISGSGRALRSYLLSLS